MLQCFLNSPIGGGGEIKNFTIKGRQTNKKVLHNRLQVSSKESFEGHGIIEYDQKDPEEKYVGNWLTGAMF